MNKYKVLLNLLTDRLLFQPDYCQYVDNIATMPQKLLSLTFSAKEAFSQKVVLVSGDSASLDIYEVSISVFYLNARNKRNKLFSLILNKIYFQYNISSPRRPRVFYNKSYLYKLKSKYKKCCRAQVRLESLIKVNKISGLDSYKIKVRLSYKYYNFLDIFNRAKIDELPFYRSYNYILEFNDGFNKSKLLKSYIYLISNYKLEQVKKYLDKYLKKGFITSSKALFIFLILFVKKSNSGLYFYINY